MTPTVTLKWRDLIFAGLLIILLFVGGLKIAKIEAALESTKMIVTVQQNVQNIQALDKALGEVMKQIEELKKAK